jgi:hypothetical protein
MISTFHINYRLFTIHFSFFSFTLFNFYSNRVFHWLKKHFLSKDKFFFIRIYFFLLQFQIIYFTNFFFFSSFHFFFSDFYNRFLFSLEFILLQKQKQIYYKIFFSSTHFHCFFNLLNSFFLHLSITFKLLFSFKILLTRLFFQLTKLFRFFYNISSSFHLCHFHYFIKTLTVLDLDHNQIANQGIQYLCNVLKNNKVKSNLLFIFLIFIIS